MQEMRVGPLDWKGPLEKEMATHSGIIDSMDINLNKLWELVMTGRPGVLQSMGSQIVGPDCE